MRFQCPKADVNLCSRVKGEVMVSDGFLMVPKTLN